MNKLEELLMAGTLALASLTASQKKADACSSAIPMGRGGTNVSLAEGASATYWNPAGLIQLERPEIEYTHGENINYEHFISYAQPINDKNAIGLNFSKRYFTKDREEYIRTDWLKFSHSRKINSKLSLGSSLTVSQKYYPDGSQVTPKEYKTFPLFIDNNFISGDFGVLYRTDKINFGILFQNVVNVRPGISIKLNDNLIFLLEGYSVFSRNEVRSGLEIKINKNFNARVGIDVNDGKLQTSSIGASMRCNNLEASIAYVYYGSQLFRRDDVRMGVTSVFTLNCKF